MCVVITYLSFTSSFGHFLGVGSCRPIVLALGFIWFFLSYFFLFWSININIYVLISEYTESTSSFACIKFFRTILSVGNHQLIKIGCFYNFILWIIFVVYFFHPSTQWCLYAGLNHVEEHQPKLLYTLNVHLLINTKHTNLVRSGFIYKYEMYFQVNMPLGKSGFLEAVLFIGWPNALN